MIEVVGAVLVASLLGSPHCAGMCGGFVCFYSTQGGGARWYSHLAYNGGRLLSYLGLGLAAGLVGCYLGKSHFLPRLFLVLTTTALLTLLLEEDAARFIKDAERSAVLRGVTL